MVTIARTVFQSFKRFSHISKYVSYISDFFSSSPLLSVSPSLLVCILNIRMSVYFIFDLRSFLFFYLPFFPLFSHIFTYFPRLFYYFLISAMFEYVRLCSHMVAMASAQCLQLFLLLFYLVSFFALCSFYFFWIQGLGFRVQGLVLRVYDEDFMARAQGARSPFFLFFFPSLLLPPPPLHPTLWTLLVISSY